jgi:hypothetical protein
LLDGPPLLPVVLSEFSDVIVSRHRTRPSNYGDW